MIQELISRDKNRPSVVMWSLANEPSSSMTVAQDYFKYVSRLCMYTSYVYFSAFLRTRLSLHMYVHGWTTFIVHFYSIILHFTFVFCKTLPYRQFVNYIEMIECILFIHCYRQLVDVTKKLDPTRPVTFACNQAYSSDKAVSSPWQHVLYIYTEDLRNFSDRLSTWM